VQILTPDQKTKLGAIGGQSESDMGKHGGKHGRRLLPRTKSFF